MSDFDLFEDSTWLEKPLTAMFLRHGLATEEANGGLVAQRQSHGSYRAKLQAQLDAYYAHEQDSTRSLFSAHSNHGIGKIYNFVTSDIPFIKNEWRKHLKASGTTALRLEQVDSLLGVISEHLAQEAQEIDLEPTAANKVALLNFRIGSNTTYRIEGQSGHRPPALALEWLKAGVPLAYILYFFARAPRGGYNWQAKRPNITLEDALELRGATMRQVKLLYPSA